MSFGTPTSGLLQHQQELEAVLDIENVDVLLDSETHCTRQSYNQL